MREMDAFEQAYKNGYAAGMKAAEELLKVTDEEIDFLLKCGCICEERANELRCLVERRSDG